MPTPHLTLTSDWPWPETLDNVVAIQAPFSVEQFDIGDFQRHGIPCPDNIRRSVAKRQAEYLAGRLCARQALLQLTGTPGIPATAADRSPIWPHGCVGSISHGNGKALAVVANRQHWRGLGVDVEELIDTSRALRLCNEILTPGEAEQLRPLPEQQQGSHISLVFSLKESLFKALYPITGKAFYFQDARLLEWHENGQALLELLVELSPDWQPGTLVNAQFSVREGHIYSVVAIPGDSASAPDRRPAASATNR